MSGSPAYFYWDIASPVLAHCPWIGEEVVAHRRSLLQAEKSVLMMVGHAKTGGQGE